MTPSNFVIFAQRHLEHGTNAAELDDSRRLSRLRSVDRLPSRRRHERPLAVENRAHGVPWPVDGPLCAQLISHERALQSVHRDGPEFVAIVRVAELPDVDAAKACAFSRIASNTGARSPGDELMTCNTSAVAVCCSSASRVSVISRASPSR